MVVRVLRWSFNRLVGDALQDVQRRTLRVLRRVFVLGVLVAIGIVLWRRLSSDDGAREPFSTGGPAHDADPRVPDTVEPDDGTCPASHPVKATSGSDVFHVPGGAFYDRTHADVCYRDAAAAEAAGLRPSKR